MANGYSFVALRLLSGKVSSSSGGSVGRILVIRAGLGTISGDIRMQAIHEVTNGCRFDGCTQVKFWLKK